MQLFLTALKQSIVKLGMNSEKSITWYNLHHQRRAPASCTAGAAKGIDRDEFGFGFTDSVIDVDHESPQ